MQTDVGQTFSAPAELIPDFNAALTSTGDLTVSAQFTTSAGNMGDIKISYSSAVTSGSLRESLPVARFVPTLGPNLSGYHITGITQTVDSINFIPITASRYRAEASSTIRVYGEVVPEPATCILALAIIVPVVAHRKRF
jgi:hypothetical protein